MTIETNSAKPIELSVQDGALAALVLARALGVGTGAQVRQFIDQAPAFSPHAGDRLDFLDPLICEMATAADGLEAVLDIIAATVTATTLAPLYILLADYIALHGTASPEEMRFLQRFGEAIGIDRLTRAALDSAAQARAASLT